MRHMKPKMNIVGVVSVLSLSLVLSACGFNSDPRSEFKDVEAVPHHDQPVDVKKVYKDSGLFIVTAPSGKLNFVEGESASYSIEVTTQYPNAAYKLTSSNLPDGAMLTPVSGKKGVYKLTWTPAIGLLPAGKANDEFQFTVDVEVGSASLNSDTAKLREIAGPSYETFTLVVNKTAENPTFQAVTLASKEVVQGDPVALTITATAPGVPADSTLSLEVEDVPWKSNEITIVQAKKAVTIQTPERSGDTFKFSGLIETKALDVPKSKKPVQARFTVQLINKAMNRKSTLETVSLTLLPKPEPTPEPKPEPTVTPTSEPKAVETAQAPTGATAEKKAEAPKPTATPVKKKTTTTKKKPAAKKTTAKKKTTTAKKKETK